MAYYIILFSPETHEAFGRSSRDVSGFTLKKKAIVDRLKPGDRLVCYMTRVSRWCGLLEVLGSPYIDASPVFVRENEPDPFAVRVPVRTRVWLPVEMAIPIHNAMIWSGLSFTRELETDSLAWTGKVRSSPTLLEERDGSFLAEKLTEQAEAGTPYPLDEEDRKKLATHRVNRQDKVVSVSVPEDLSAAEPSTQIEEGESRESIRMQALIARIGAEMGLSIWIPRADRGRVLREWEGGAILERLPLNYDDTTLRTIEQIDVLWLRGRSIVRAFEVEHTTSVYSGILRMADLLALQPNMDIRLHIVAPAMKREKVFQEIRRPVFSLLEKGPLAESCTYLSYDSVRELSDLKHLGHLSDSVLDEYTEEAE